MAPEARPLPASFRDPDGFLFTREGTLFRQVNASGKEDYELLMRSGLYEALRAADLIVPHEEVGPAAAAIPGAHQVLRPQLVPFVSHPWEWCFSQLRDAALLTLKVAETALEFGMTTKDASAFNVQFIGARPVFIDTLSFTRYEEGVPWAAYRQFCQHFLAPLALMALRDVRLGRLSQLHLDGIPLDLASALLPRSSRLRFSLLAHVHLHARAQRRYADAGAPKRGRGVSKLGYRGLLDSLRSAVRRLTWRPGETEWGDYYDGTNYTEAAADAKRRLVCEHLDRLRPAVVWDLGANTGVYSRCAAQRGAFTLSGDLDPAAVEKNYREAHAAGERNLLPLLIDLTNPSPGAGWANAERASLVERGPAELVLALALVHHLAISNNVPLPRVAELFSRLGRALVIEFVPKEDSQVQRLLATRKDIFPEYTTEGFERAFEPFFTLEHRDAVEGSARVLYLMRARQSP
jgi:hypothetical protein